MIYSTQSLGVYLNSVMPELQPKIVFKLCFSILGVNSILPTHKIWFALHRNLVKYLLLDV